MPKEIELKAHVKDWQALLNKLRQSKFISNENYEEKKDIYFFNPLIEQSFRVRKETFTDSNNKTLKNTVFTVKEKVLENGIETNREVELDLDFNKFDSSIEFFESMGFRKTINKEKKGYSFVFSYFKTPLHIELLKVNSLGWFFEIEFIVDEQTDKRECDLLVQYLYKTLDYFNISHDDIEMKYYSQLIEES
jgi:predicted adenylyl cyclase CyaB